MLKTKLFLNLLKTPVFEITLGNTIPKKQRTWVHKC